MHKKVATQSILSSNQQYTNKHFWYLVWWWWIISICHSTQFLKHFCKVSLTLLLPRHLTTAEEYFAEQAAEVAELAVAGKWLQLRLLPSMGTDTYPTMGNSSSQAAFAWDMGQFLRRVYYTAELEVYGDWLMALINWQIKLSCPDLRWKNNHRWGGMQEMGFFSTSNSVPLALDEIDRNCGFIKVLIWVFFFKFLNDDGFGFLPVRNTVQLSHHETSKKVSAGAARCVAESEGLQVGKNWWPSWLWSMSGRRWLISVMLC